MLTRIDCYVYYICIAMFVFIGVMTMYVTTHCIFVFLSLCLYYAYYYCVSLYIFIVGDI